MLLLQNFTHLLLRTSPTNQVVDGEPQDVEKDTRKTMEGRDTAYDRLAHSHLSSGFEARGRALQQLDALSSHQSPTYRSLPIISGILIPFSILLSIPSLTGRWYIRTDGNDVTLETHPNSFLLDLGMGFSMACAVLANISLIVRFSERNVLKMTWLCIIFLTMHGEQNSMTISTIIDCTKIDMINISAVTIFGVQHRFDDGFTYGQSFWFTVCSTIASTTTNITLIIDYSRTRDFVNSGACTPI